MFTLPKNQMTFMETLIAIFLCWKSLILPLLPLSILCVFLTALPAFGIKLSYLAPRSHVFFIVYAISYALYLIPSGAIIMLISSALHGKKIDLVEALRIGVSRFPKMLMTGIILIVAMYILVRFGLLFSHISYYLGIIIAFLLIVATSPFLIPASPLVVIDNKWPFDAITSGVRLVKTNWLRVFGIMAVISVITIPLNVFTAHFMAAAFIVSVLTLPLTLSMTVVITENLKLKP
ncbi:MAG TPA: hypothetical protein VGU44_04355 [Gammaproteobacteria bacterium]|nr:hypothetical protein [Gammaproteobacteria bacterium]HEV2613077.1 hypothetical protein [Gammaproteobacteria bacterium]